MSSKASIPNPSGHPARFSGAVVDKLRELLLGLRVATVSAEWMRHPYIFDPFAGTGERLAEILGDEFEGRGVELYSDFIVTRQLVKVGDATKIGSYPLMPFVIVTSPVYPNGMAEAWDVSESDTSTRNTYAANRTQKSKPNDMGVMGYRGTKRGGRSVKRAAYWRTAEQCVVNWRVSPCEAIFLNVSDFMSGGEVEPLVKDWRDLLKRHGFRIDGTYRIRTPRHRGNDNADQRVDTEKIIVAVRA